MRWVGVWWVKGEQSWVGSEGKLNWFKAWFLSDVFNSKGRLEV